FLSVRSVMLSSSTVASKRSKAHRLFETLENDLTASSGDESPFIAAYLAQINPSLRILSHAASCSANSVPDDQLGSGSYDCTLRDCDCYVAGVPAGSCGKPQCQRGPTFRPAPREPLVLSAWFMFGWIVRARR